MPGIGDQRTYIGFCILLNSCNPPTLCITYFFMIIIQFKTCDVIEILRQKNRKMSFMILRKCTKSSERIIVKDQFPVIYHVLHST